MSIGDRILELRKAQGLSQGDLAKQMEVSRQAVSKWEQDLSSPDTLRLVKLADVLNTDVEYLATGRKTVYDELPEAMNVVRTVERVVETVVEKPVIRKVVRIKYLRNPVEFFCIGFVGFLLGLIVGLLI